MIRSEKYIERKFYEGVKDLGGIAVKNPPYGHKNLPDRTVYLPGGFCCFAEIKAPGKKPNEKQMIRFSFFRGLGFDVFVIDSVESCNRILQYFKVKACNISRTHTGNTREPIF